MRWILLFLAVVMLCATTVNRRHQRIVVANVYSGPWEQSPKPTCSVGGVAVETRPGWWMCQRIPEQGR